MIIRANQFKDQNDDFIIFSGVGEYSSDHVSVEIHTSGNASPRWCDDMIGGAKLCRISQFMEAGGPAVPIVALKSESMMTAIFEITVIALHLAVLAPDRINRMALCAGTSWMLENRAPHIVEGDYSPKSSVDI